MIMRAGAVAGLAFGEATTLAHVHAVSRAKM
jgi:hypothetical protein